MCDKPSVFIHQNTWVSGHQSYDRLIGDEDKKKLRKVNQFLLYFQHFALKLILVLCIYYMIDQDKLKTLIEAMNQNTQLLHTIGQFLSKEKTDSKETNKADSSKNPVIKIQHVTPFESFDS